MSVVIHEKLKKQNLMISWNSEKKINLWKSFDGTQKEENQWIKKKSLAHEMVRPQNNWTMKQHTN